MSLFPGTVRQKQTNQKNASVPSRPPSKELQNRVAQAVPLEMRGSPCSALLWLQLGNCMALPKSPGALGISHAPEPQPLDLLQGLFFKGDLLKLSRLAWNLPSSCLSLLGAKIPRVSHHVGLSCLPPLAPGVWVPEAGVRCLNSVPLLVF